MIRAYVFKECEMSRAELLKKKKFVRTVKFWTLSSTNLNGTITLLSSHLGRISWASSRHGEQVIKFILSSTLFLLKLQISHVSKGLCTSRRFKVITLQRLNKIVSAPVTLHTQLRIIYNKCFLNDGLVISDIFANMTNVQELGIRVERAELLYRERLVK